MVLMFLQDRNLHQQQVEMKNNNNSRKFAENPHLWDTAFITHQKETLH